MKPNQKTQRGKINVYNLTKIAYQVYPGLPAIKNVHFGWRILAYGKMSPQAVYKASLRPFHQRKYGDHTAFNDATEPLTEARQPSS